MENAKLEHLYLREMLERMAPVLAGPFAEGVEQGVFRMRYPVEGIETILLLGHMMFDSRVFEWKDADYVGKVQAFLHHAERMLGTEEGELEVLLQLFGQKP